MDLTVYLQIAPTVKVTKLRAWELPKVTQRKAAPASALGLIHVYINLLTAGWKNNLAERERENGK